MDTWQFISLGVAAGLSYLYWLERKKRLQATSDRDRALTQMFSKSELDARTGLLSQDAFDKALDQATQKADRAGGSYAVLSIVLDNFSLIQDGFDEEASSQVIKLSAQRLLSSAGTEASVCKGEGGEFAVLVGVPSFSVQ